MPRTGFESPNGNMRLIGKYSFETLQRVLQGFFSFYKSQDLYILELFSLRVVLKPADAEPGYCEFYVLQNQGADNGYKRIGKVTLI